MLATRARSKNVPILPLLQLSEWEAKIFILWLRLFFGFCFNTGSHVCDSGNKDNDQEFLLWVLIAVKYLSVNFCDITAP